MDRHRLQLDRRTAAEWITQAERYERMAAHCGAYPTLRENFQRLAVDAREKARHVGSDGRNPS
jgi:DnaJ-domain-containing protein 1